MNPLRPAGHRIKNWPTLNTPPKAGGDTPHFARRVLLVRLPDLCHWAAPTFSGRNCWQACGSAVLPKLPPLGEQTKCERRPGCSRLFKKGQASGRRDGDGARDGDFAGDLLLQVLGHPREFLRAVGVKMISNAVRTTDVPPVCSTHKVVRYPLRWRVSCDTFNHLDRFRCPRSLASHRIGGPPADH